MRLYYRRHHILTHSNCSNKNYTAQTKIINKKIPKSHKEFFFPFFGAKEEGVRGGKLLLFPNKRLNPKMHHTPFINRGV